jgi:hypothetical protein
MQFGVKFRSLAAVALSGMFLIAGCSDSSPPTQSPPPVLAEAVVSPQTVTLEEGASFEFWVVPFDEEGGEMSQETFIADVAWSSSDESVATVSGSGEVTAVGPGTATITADVQDVESNSASGSAEVTVE